MHLTGPITGTVILPVKDGVNLDNVVLDDATGSSNSSSDNGSSAASIFAHLANTLKAQPGLRRQYWVGTLFSVLRSSLSLSRMHNI